MSASMIKRIKKRKPKAAVKPIKVSYTNILLDFKLQLIAEIKKHEVIWRNNAERKNKKSGNAWEQVLNALKKVHNRSHIKYGKKDSPELTVKKCQFRWRELKKEYELHISYGKTMSEELAADMAFMAPLLQHVHPPINQLQQTHGPVASTSTVNGTTMIPEIKAITTMSTIPANNYVSGPPIGDLRIAEPMQVDPTANTVQTEAQKKIIEAPARINVSNGLNLSPPRVSQSHHEPSTSTANGRMLPPKAKTVENHNGAKVSVKKGSSTDRAQALAIIDYLFSALPAATLSNLRASLVRAFTKLLPEEKERIILHATPQMSTAKDYLKINWSGLLIPADICQAVWLSHVHEMIQRNFRRE